MCALFQFKKRDNVVQGEKDILVAKLHIENEETFHMKNLYKLIYEWLMEEEFTDIYDDPIHTPGNPEIFYMERILGTGAREHRIRWRCFKYPGRNTYYRYFLKIDYTTINMKSIEVMHQGYKMKTDRGDVIINLEAWLQLDYKDEWKDAPFLNKRIIQRMFRNRIYKEQVEAQRIDLYKLTYRLQNTIKQYLKLKTLYEMPKPFHPEKGI